LIPQVIKKRNLAIAKANKMIRRHNQKLLQLQSQGRISAEDAEQRSKKERPLIRGMGSLRFAGRVRQELGLKRKIHRVGKKELDYDDPKMEENRNQIRAYWASGVLVEMLFLLATCVCTQRSISC
jgi:hypothetical protein